MGTQIKELTNYLNNLLNIEIYQDYCPNGLQVQGKDTINKIAFSVSATVESIEQAVRWGADALIVHHGAFWRHQGARAIVGAHYDRLAPLIKNDINLIAYHLPLDGHIDFGNAAGLAKALGLVNLKPFGEYKRAYVGVRADLSTPLKASAFKSNIQEVLKREIILASHDESEIIKNIGIITGGANNDWYQAKENGLNAYLTGEISEYNWHDAKEERIHFFACGHHATERYGVLELKALLEKEFKVTTTFFDSLNPV